MNNKKSVYGIIAEYNPFHFGHFQQIQTVRREFSASLVIVAMSGHFLQRGIPALMDKWTRAKVAVDCGADLVIELPVRSSLASSDDFAAGSLLLLSSIGVDKLCFGVEAEFLKVLNEYVEIISEHPDYDLLVKSYLDESYSYVKANELALSKLSGRESRIPPNALLGIAYLRAIHTHGLEIEAQPLERRGEDYHSLNLQREQASAEAIRSVLFQHLIDWKALEKMMPKVSFDALYSYPKYLNEEVFYKQILSAIFLLGKEGLKRIRGVKEGLENKIYEAALKTGSFGELLNFCTSKRYTASSIRRILFSALLGIEGPIDLSSAPELKQHRILAMSEKGKKYLAARRSSEGFRPIVNFARDIKRFQVPEAIFRHDIAATAIYATQCEKIRSNEDYLIKPYIAEQGSRL